MREPMRRQDDKASGFRALQPQTLDASILAMCRELIRERLADETTHDDAAQRHYAEAAHD